MNNHFKLLIPLGAGIFGAVFLGAVYLGTVSWSESKQHALEFIRCI